MQITSFLKPSTSTASISTFAFLVLTMTASPATASMEEHWKLAKEDSSFKVYTRSVEGSPYKSFKAEIKIQQSPEQIVDTIRDISQFTTWMADTTHAEVIEQSETHQMAYVINKTPWPVQDRDGIFHYEVISVTNGSYKIVINAKPEAVAQKPEYVRVKSATGYWEVTAIPSGSLVTYQLQLDPGGSIPSWLANTTVIDSPEYTLKKLKQTIESK